MPNMNIDGFLLGLFVFFLIGLFHPIVIKMEYYFGKGYWWILCFPGIIFVFASLFLQGIYSMGAGLIGFVLLWSTQELFKQHQRVKKGQARKNPKRTY